MSLIRTLSTLALSVVALSTVSYFTASAAELNIVSTAALSEIALYPERSAPATVVSLNDTDISAEIAAQVTDLPARVGDVVEAGGILAYLDCEDFELNRATARARLQALEARIDLAKKRLARTERLTRNQTVSEEVFDERESELAVLQADRRAAVADVARSGKDVKRCAITSPFRALVTERSSSVGQYAQVGTPMVHIIDMQSLEVSAQVFTDDVTELMRVREIRFENSGHPSATKVRTVLPSVNTRTRNREVRLDFTNEPALPGAAGKILWRNPRPHLPGKFIVKRGGHLGVFVQKDNKAQFVSLPNAEAGRASPVDIALESRIITEGYLGLNDGDAVTTGNKL